MIQPLEFRVMLVVADLAANLRFYEEMLGLRRVMAWDGGAILSLAPGRSLELRAAKPGAAGEGLSSGELMLGIAVADADAAHDALAAAGVPIARKLKDNPWGLGLPDHRPHPGPRPGHIGKETTFFPASKRPAVAERRAFGQEEDMNRRGNRAGTCWRPGAERS